MTFFAKNHENFRIQLNNQENHENPATLLENHENYENHKIAYENMKILTFFMRILKILKILDIHAIIKKNNENR